MQPDQTEQAHETEVAVGSVEWILAELERMKADLRAGKKFPEDRETILRRMGHGDYESSYLQSPLWGRIRRRIFKRDGHACVRCSEKATQVHHLTYTEPVLRGEDDSQLVSVCAECHKRVEFDGNGNRRTDLEKQRVLEDRDGARRERIAAEQARLHDEQVRTAAGGRCFRCKGDTEGQIYHSDGRVYRVPGEDGEPVDVWACLPCRSEVEHDKEGRARTDEEKLKLLRKKVNVRYTRPGPSLFGKAFFRLNAMQREGIMNEFHWNAANRSNSEIRTTEPEKFELLRARYESTKANGRDRQRRK